MRSICNHGQKMRSRRIGLDFHVVAGKYQGSRTHVIEMFSRAIDDSPDIEFFAFTEEPSVLLRSATSFSKPNVHIVPIRNLGPIARLNWQLPYYSVKLRLDAIHTQYMIPFPVVCRRIVTVHDVLYESHGEYFSRLFRARSRLLIRLAATRADHVITVSEYSKSEISGRYGVNPDRISILHNGVDVDHFRIATDNEASTLRSIGLAEGEYILTVGRLEPRKNHVALVRAYSELGTSAPPLIIVGQRDFGYASLFKCISELNLTQRVRILDNINDSMLPIVYRGARFFVYPTAAEGFGIPLIEAMAAGTPVITTNSTAIPEIVGNAAILVPPNNIQELSKQMKELLDDFDRMKTLRLQGFAQAAKFSWSNSARGLRRLYLSS